MNFKKAVPLADENLQMRLLGVTISLRLKGGKKECGGGEFVQILGQEVFLHFFNGFCVDIDQKQLKTNR